MTRKLIPVALALTLSASAAFASDERKDFQIAKDVVSAVNRYAYFTIFDDITIGVDDGVVTLDGKVTMPYKADEIRKRVVKVDGVKEVQNRISVLPVSSWDNELRYRIARAIYGNSNFWN